jgi:hypothetical protein
VTQELLNGADVDAGFEQVGGEGVSEGVGGDTLGETDAGGGRPDGALGTGLVQVVAAELAGGRVATAASRRKQPLPRPGLGCGAQLAGKRVGQCGALGAGRQPTLECEVNACSHPGRWR